MASPTELLTSGVAKMTATLGQIARRVLVHLVALGVAGFVSAAATSILPDSITTTVGVYIGLICLFPRGNVRSPSWYMPTLLGLGQAALLVLLGMPWPLVFLWGGLQTWMQRYLGCWGSFGWEWTALPFLVLAMCDILQNLLLWKIPLWPLLSITLVLLVGAVAQRVYRRTQAANIYKTMLEEALQRLHAAVSARLFPADVQQQAELLLSQATAWKSVRTADEAAYQLVEQVDSVSRSTENMANEIRVLRGDAKNLLAKAVLRSSRWKDKAERRPKTDALIQDLRACNASLLEILRKHTAAANPHATDDATRMASYEDAARELLFKQETLPDDMRRHVERIATAALGIVECMRQDPADVPAGHKFLNRYLPATHRVVDEYVRLAGENASQEDVVAALARSGEILERMATAFAEERESMLQNDAINYTAELNALDTMLKMQGK